MTQHHALLNEFPEYKERIHNLKVENERFRQLFDEYHELDRQIVRMDDNIEPASDEAMEKAKFRRVELKDELYRLLTTAQP